MQEGSIEFRGLKDTEFEEWFDHLAEVFESTGREYFVRHWNNDPNANLQDIFVAYDTENKRIAATLKVFRRKFYVNGETVLLGGIGEVSTKVAYRSKGFAKTLLELAVQHMIKLGITVSWLSASKARPYYEKLGWKVIPELLANQKIPIQLIQKFGNDGGIQQVDFSSEAILARLSKLHQEYVIAFNGPVVRSDPAYWSRWIQQEAKGQAYTFSSSGQIVAFLCAGINNGKLTIKDFIVDTTSAGETKNILRHFVGHVVSKNIGELSIDNHVDICFPAAITGGTALYDEHAVDITKLESFLYRVVDPRIFSSTDNFIFGILIIAF